MLISSSTNVYGGIGEVTTFAFNDVYNYILLILGIILAFFILELLLKNIYPHKYNDNNKEN